MEDSVTKKISAAQIRTSFSAVEAARYAAVPYQTVDFWARSGFITPSLAAANGRGSDRRYSFDDLIALGVARELRKEGASMQALRKVVTALRTEGRSMAEFRWIVVGSDIKRASSCDEVMSMLKKPRQLAFPAFICDGPKAVKLIEERIEKKQPASVKKAAEAVQVKARKA
jgi:DNA-binding transcriptional MerR regulator